VLFILQMKIILDVKYPTGEKIEADNKTYTVIGYEFVVDRGIRYVLLYMDSGKADWAYLYDFEIEVLKNS